MKRTTTIAICAVIALVACDAGAQDASNGWLIGGSAVGGWLKRDDGTIDDTKMGFKFFGQYRFNSWLGAEGSYYNSGEFQSSATSAGGEKFELLYQGWMLQGIGYVPLPWEELEWYLKGGYYSFRVDSNVNGSSAGSGSDNGAVLGTGIAIKVTESMYFRTSIDWYDADTAKFRTVELGLEYRF